MTCFTNSQSFFLCSDIPFEKTGFSGLYKKSWNCFYRPIKAIPLKVFGRWGAGKITFFQKGVFPVKHFCNIPFYICSLCRISQIAVNVSFEDFEIVIEQNDIGAVAGFDFADVGQAESLCLVI